MSETVKSINLTSASLTSNSRPISPNYIHLILKLTKINLSYSSLTFSDPCLALMGSKLNLSAEQFLKQLFAQLAFYELQFSHLKKCKPPQVIHRFFLPALKFPIWHRLQHALKHMQPHANLVLGSIRLFLDACCCNWRVSSRTLSSRTLRSRGTS